MLLLQLVYTEAVMENSPSSRFVLKVSAVDPDVGANGQVSYSLHGPNADKFHLNYRTGTHGWARSSGAFLIHLPDLSSFLVSFSALTCYTWGRTKF